MRLLSRQNEQQASEFSGARRYGTNKHLVIHLSFLEKGGKALSVSDGYMINLDNYIRQPIDASVSKVGYSDDRKR